MPLADEKYPLFTSRRRETGVDVGWIAALPDGRLGFTTDANRWKVKHCVEIRQPDRQGR